MRGLSDEQIEAPADPNKAPGAGLPTIEDAVKAGSWLCGPPELIVEQLHEIERRFPGLAPINVGSLIGTPQSVARRSMDIAA